MPRPISMSCVEILPSLLNKTKVQTIRPIPKNGKPMWNVGDKTYIMWKQRTSPKGSFFHKKMVHWQSSQKQERWFLNTWTRRYQVLMFSQKLWDK